MAKAKCERVDSLRFDGGRAREARVELDAALRNGADTADFHAVMAVVGPPARRSTSSCDWDSRRSGFRGFGVGGENQETRPSTRSATWTALSAFPLRRLSPQAKRDSPFSRGGRGLTRPTRISSIPAASNGVGYSLSQGRSTMRMPGKFDTTAVAAAKAECVAAYNAVGAFAGPLGAPRWRFRRWRLKTTHLYLA